MKRSAPWLVLGALLPLVALLAYAYARSRVREEASGCPRGVHAARAPRPPAGTERIVSPKRRKYVTGGGTKSGRPALTRRRLRDASRVTLPLAGLSLVLLLLTSVQLTSATFADQVTMAQVRTAAGTVNAPTALGLSEQPTAIRASWTAPSTGLSPSGYEVYRRADAGSWPGTLVQTVAAPTTQWDDTTAAECTLWWYRVRSQRTNLLSGYATEQSLRVDRAAPTVSDANLVWTGSTPSVANFVRVNPGGTTEVFANVADNCDDPGALTVSFAFGAPIGSTVTPTYNAAGWTPIAGGPTYNYRYQYTLPANAVADGQAVTWNVSATDIAGNNSVTAGTPFTGDGQAPVFQQAEIVSAFTNFYDTGLGYGEIPSDGTERLSGSYVYADYTDLSGVASITANLAAGGIKTAATAVPLVEDSYTTYSGEAWSWRSAATTINTGLADGIRNFTVTAIDRVGNSAATSANQPVQIDDTPPAAAQASCVNGGTNDNVLSAPDYTDFIFGTANTIFPDSVKSGWDGSAIVQTATLTNNASNDYFDFNTPFGIQLFQGTGATQGFTLGVNARGTNLSYPGTTFGLQDRYTLRVSFGVGTGAVAAGNSSTGFIGTNLRDAAGNKVAANFSEACSRNPW